MSRIGSRPQSYPKHDSYSLIFRSRFDRQATMQRIATPPLGSPGFGAVFAAFSAGRPEPRQILGTSRTLTGRGVRSVNRPPSAGA